MKKFMIILLAAVMALPLCALELKLRAQHKLTGNDGLSGKMNFSLKMLDGNKKFKIIFKNAKGDWLMFWHFEPKNNKVYCYCPTHKCNHDLPAKLELNKELKIDVSIAAEHYAVLAVNGKETACMALPKDKLAAVYLYAEGGRTVIDNFQWQVDAKTPMRFFTGFLNGHQSGVIAKVPQGDFELSFDFVPVKLSNSNGHYGIELRSAKAGDGKLQVVFWEKGIQVIRGKGKAKWLGNFPADFAGKKHSFKLKLVDSNLYEFIVDGKRINTFEADIVPGGEVAIWGYKNWRFEISDFSIKPLAEEDDEE